ncbi:hypothetical protein HPB52_016062 [Rhipicephalus sanguineus]|uniref:THAP-type domain-containing protein n=1 Tax=Rhipicephalus sanguineus TaxID=34632 RepID=A0A9D4PDX6_RHISA|nr:hypothetical protein HPB52_016062 [Rhipicephalus sanguineus]
MAEGSVAPAEAEINVFLNFPKDKTLRDAWQRAVRRDGWTLKDADVLCSEHFEAGCFDRTGQTTRLRQGSIPTVFPAFPAHLQKPSKRKRDTPKCRSALSPAVSAEPLVEMPSEPSSPTKEWYRQKVEKSAEEETIQQAECANGNKKIGMSGDLFVDRLNEAKEKAAPETMAEGSVAPAEAEINVFLNWPLICQLSLLLNLVLLLSITYRTSRPEATLPNADVAGAGSSAHTEVTDAAPRVTEGTPGPATVPRHRAVVLPKLQIPTFSGALRDWQTFWDHFSATTHRNEDLLPIEKFKYLLSYLSGVAKRAIEGIRLTEDNYAIAIRTLTERFGRRDLLINEHIDHLLALPPVKSSADVDKLRLLYDKVQFRVSALTGLGVSPDQCLPDDLAILYRQKSKEAAQEYVCSSDPRRKSSPGRTPSAFSRLLPEEDVELSRPRGTFAYSVRTCCRICSSYGRGVPLMQQLSAHHRGPATFNSQLRKNGLASSVVSATDDISLSSVELFTSAAQTLANATTVARRASHRRARHEHAVSDIGPKRPERNHALLLQTGRVWIECGSQKRLVRILLDSGSQRTFIRADVSKDLDARVSEPRTFLGAFGHSKPREVIRSRREVSALRGSDVYWKVATGKVDHLTSNLTAVAPRNAKEVQHFRGATAAAHRPRRRITSEAAPFDGKTTKISSRSSRRKRVVVSTELGSSQRLRSPAAFPRNNDTSSRDYDHTRYGDCRDDAVDGPHSLPDRTHRADLSETAWPVGHTPTPTGRLERELEDAHRLLGVAKFYNQVWLERPRDRSKEEDTLREIRAGSDDGDVVQEGRVHGTSQQRIRTASPSEALASPGGLTRGAKRQRESHRKRDWSVRAKKDCRSERPGDPSHWSAFPSRPDE